MNDFSENINFTYFRNCEKDQFLDRNNNPRAKRLVEIIMDKTQDYFKRETALALIPSFETKERAPVLKKGIVTGDRNDPYCYDAKDLVTLFSIRGSGKDPLVEKLSQLTSTPKPILSEVNGKTIVVCQTKPIPNTYGSFPEGLFGKLYLRTLTEKEYMKYSKMSSKRLQDLYNKWVDKEYFSSI